MFQNDIQVGKIHQKDILSWDAIDIFSQFKTF